MATKDNLTLLTAADKEKLLKKSAKFLPDNPSNKGFSAAQNKAALYEPAALNFEYIKRLIEQLATCFDAIDASHDSTKLDKITNSLSSGDVAAYVVNNNNGSYTQAYMKVVGIEATPWTIPSRRANGEIVVGSPTDNAHAVNLSYANSHYAPKITSGEKVYGTDELGAQKAYDVDSDLVGDGAVVRRETVTGTVVVGTPTSNTHATTKAYVDDKVAALGTAVDYKGSKTVAQLNALTGQKNGQLYNVTDGGTLSAGSVVVVAGDNVVWNGSSWDIMRGTIDLSGYVQKTAKIAGVNLADDITKTELLNALEIPTELDKKANKDGNYPTLTVGSADSLTPYGENSGVEDDSVFRMQTTGGSSDVSNVAYLRALRGNSVAFNQLNSDIEKTNTSSNGITRVVNQDNSVTYSGTATSNAYFNIGSNSINIVSGHKYFFKSGTKSGNASFSAYFGYVGNIYYYLDANNGTIFTANQGNASGKIGLCVGNGVSVNLTIKKEDVMLINLTQMFGAGNEPTSVEEFNRLFPEPYYEYNAGELLSSKVNGIKNVGYNQLSLDRTQGTLNGNNYSKGNKQDFKDTEYYLGLADNDYILRTIITNFSISGNSITFTSAGGGYGVGLPIKVIAGQTYSLEFVCNITGENKFVSWYDKNGLFISITSSASGDNFVAPSNAYWGVIILGRGANTYTYSNISFHLTWDSSRTGYEPYEKHEYTLPNVELRSAGSVYDELTPDGTLIRRVGVVDLGTLSWNWQSANGRWYSNGLLALAKAPSNNNNKANILSNKYEILSFTDADTNSKGLAISTSGTLFLYTSDSTNQPSGYLFYELATPTETQDDVYKYQERQQIDDFGTQEQISDQEIQVPARLEFFYPVDYKAFIDSLGGREDIDYDSAEIVSHDELDEVDDKHDALYAIMQENVGGTLRHQLADKASIDFNNTAWVDLGSLTPDWSSTSSSWRIQNIPNIKIDSFNLLCAIYKTKNSTGKPASSDMIVWKVATNNGYLYFYDSNLSSSMTVAQVKAYFKGILLAYEKE